jgi:hypothetical protein
VKSLAILLLFAWADDFASIEKKLDLISSEKVPRGSRVILTSAEINAFARTAAHDITPKGVRDLKLVLGDGNATATAQIDFLELNKLRHGQSNWLMDKILEGERPIKVIAHMQSEKGQARVDVDRVEIGGAAIEGSALQFLIEHYVVPQFPNAKVAQWFTLEHHVDHLEIRPSAVTVAISK